MILVVIIVLALALYGFQKKRIDPVLRRRYPLLLNAIVFLLGLYLVKVALKMKFNGDEFEHVHSGWYVDQGFVPFTDFFQHHNSLFWYTMIPFFKVFGHTVNAIRALRISNLLMVLGMAFTAYRIALLSTRSKETGTLAAILLLSVITFVVNGLEIRPDVPQTLLGLVSIYFLLLFLQTGRTRHFAWCALAAGFSFVFLQKAVFLLAAYFVLFAWLLFKRALSVKKLLLFGGVFTLPLLLYAAWLAYTRSLHDYLLTNWLLNLRFMRHKSIWVNLSHSLIENTFFWLVAAASVIHIFLQKNAARPLKIVAFLGLALMVTLIPLNRVHAQYFLLAIAVLSVAAACGLALIFVRLGLNEFFKLIVVLLILVQPKFHIDLKHEFGNNKIQIEKIKYVLDNTRPTDCLYDGTAKFNVFRPDLHYFWYSIGDNRGLDTYNKLTGNRFGKLDMVQLIREKKPKFISDNVINMKDSGLDREYIKTSYPRIYIRKEGAP